jgi:hypothetical protein
LGAVWLLSVVESCGILGLVVSKTVWWVVAVAGHTKREEKKKRNEKWFQVNSQYMVPSLTHLGFQVLSLVRGAPSPLELSRKKNRTLPYVHSFTLPGPFFASFLRLCFCSFKATFLFVLHSWIHLNLLHQGKYSSTAIYLGFFLAPIFSRTTCIGLSMEKKGYSTQI